MFLSFYRLKFDCNLSVYTWRSGTSICSLICGNIHYSFFQGHKYVSSFEASKICEVYWQQNFKSWRHLLKDYHSSTLLKLPIQQLNFNPILSKQKFILFLKKKQGYREEFWDIIMSYIFNFLNSCNFEVSTISTFFVRAIKARNSKSVAWL